MVREPALLGVEAVDSTGCGDCFAAGFLAAFIRGAPLRQCARLGCVAGAAVLAVPGGEIPPERWAWARGRWAEMGGDAALLP